MYPFMTLPVHVHTFIPITRWYLPVNVSTAVDLHRCTCPSVYLFSLFLLFLHNTFPLTCWGIYTQILMFRLCLKTKTYLSPQLLVYLPLNVPDHDSASSFSYFKYSIWLTAKIYPPTSRSTCSTCPQIYQFISIPVQYFSLFGITLICFPFRSSARVRTHRPTRK